jgi:hypothetical protein
VGRPVFQRTHIYNCGAACGQWVVDQLVHRRKPRVVSSRSLQFVTGDPKVILVPEKNNNSQPCSFFRGFSFIKYSHPFQIASHSMAPGHAGTFQPLQHRSGTLRDRLHNYTTSTLGAGGSINEAVRLCDVRFPNRPAIPPRTVSIAHDAFALSPTLITGRSPTWRIVCCLGSGTCR